MSIIDRLSEQGPLHSPDSSVRNIKLLDFKYLGLYFTASWCGACRRYSSTLQETVRIIEQKSPGIFKMVTIKMDHQQPLFGAKFWRFSEMSDNTTSFLTRYFKVFHIPTIIILNKNGSIVTNNGFGDILQHRQNVTKIWDYANK